MAGSVLILLAATVIQRTIGFGRGVMFCRWLTPETLGQWEMAYSFLLLAAPLIVLGVPGSFGRYLEHFSQRGHLQTFLLRTAAWTAACCLVGVTVVLWFAPHVSQLLFGSPDRAELIRGIGFCLVAIIVHHSLTSLLTALRLFRVVTVVNFAQSTIFATVALALLCFNASVSSILMGYATGCVLASLGAILWVWPGLREIDRPIEPLPHFNFWPKLLRFAFFVWVSNLLAHLFALVDRYMIIHYSGMEASEALNQVGYYHSSRIVPLLLVSFADLLSGLVMPHLSHDWEAGRRQQVGARLNLTVKLTGLGMTAFGVAVLLFGPLLFDVVLQGKYSDGLVVLPWVLAGCVWYGIYSIAQNYLWCAEKAKLAAAPLAIGLGVNVLLNLLLLPVWGLFGAVVATGLSTLLCLATVLVISRRHGMQLDIGTALVALGPLALTAGVVPAAAIFATLLVAALGTDLVLNNAERTQLKSLAAEWINKWTPKTQRYTSPSGGA